MVKILIVEDSRSQSGMIVNEVRSRGNLIPVLAESFSQAKELLEANPETFFAALLDINLPDAPHGEIVDLVMEHGIASIVFTGEFSDELRERMLAKRVVDYVIKENASSIVHVVSQVERLIRNQGIKVLVVDDSRSARKMIVAMLKIHKFQTVEAENGVMAMEVLAQNPDVLLVITDYNMPHMDGFELTRKIRRLYTKNQIAIIGLSSHGNNLLSARFLKRGANDFITKPCLTEEFFVRVTQNIEIIEYIHALKDAAIKDFLTGLPNRRHFMDVGEKWHAHAVNATITLIAGTMDIDFFKKVNDTYGHEAGDTVLKKVSALIKPLVDGTDLVARVGGEEFSVLLVNKSSETAYAWFEQLRTRIQAMEIPYNDHVLRVTISIGVCQTPGESLAEMLDIADKRLYDAKRSGRNRVSVAN
ncbi:MAG: diguanylate cyclase [Magnetococcales bacterium]|nr:diguanylate cyclase [Magnetococcales bacterium]